MKYIQKSLNLTRKDNMKTRKEVFELKKIIKLSVKAGLIALVFSIIFALQGFAAFKDVKRTDYYSDAADALSRAGILSGYPDGTFGAEKPVTRAEMAAIVCRVMKITDDAEALKGYSGFDDVDASHWASGYVGAALEQMIISGDGNGKFRPEDSVKFEEALKMVICAFSFDYDTGIVSDDWAAEYLYIGDEMEITKSVRGTRGNASSRGDVAVMIYNAFMNDIYPPVIVVPGGEYEGTVSVEIEAYDSNEMIYYTIDGSDPVTNGEQYKNPVRIQKSCVLKAVSVRDRAFISEVSEEEYEIVEAGKNEPETRDEEITFNDTKKDEEPDDSEDDYDESRQEEDTDYEAEEKKEEPSVKTEEEDDDAPVTRVTYYYDSPIPKYENITGSEQVAAPMSYEQSDAEFIRFFYDSNEAEKEKYKRYLLNHGWTLNGVESGGDTRGESEITGFSYITSEGEKIAQVVIYFFPDCGDVDLLCVLKAR